MYRDAVWSRAISVVGFVAICEGCGGGHAPAASPGASVAPAAVNVPSPEVAKGKRTYLESLEDFKPHGCACDSMDCFDKAMDRSFPKGVPRAPATEAEHDAAWQLESEVDDCLRRIRRTELQHEFEALTAEMCSCRSDDCKASVLKKVVRAVVAKQRFAAIQHSQPFSRSKDKLEGCFGQPIFK